MKTDVYTKFIMTIIALCLVVLAWETVDKAMAPEAQAQVAPAGPTMGQTFVTCDTTHAKCLAVKVFK